MQFILPDESEIQREEDGEHDAESEEVEEDDDSEDKRRRKRKKKKALMAQHPNRLTFAEIKANKLLYAFLKKYISNCESVEVRVTKYFSILLCQQSATNLLNVFLFTQIQNVMQMYQLCDALLSIPATELDRRNALSSELVRTYLHASGMAEWMIKSFEKRALLCFSARHFWTLHSYSLYSADVSKSLKFKKNGLPSP